MFYINIIPTSAATIPIGRPIEGVDQSHFFYGKTTSNHEGFPVFVADRLEEIK